MSDDLQALIDKIRSEGVAKAQDEAGRIVAEAKERAARTIREAEAEAERIVKKAGEEAKLASERGARTLEQAARDVILNVGQGVEALLRSLIAERSAQALDASLLRGLIAKAVETYMNGAQAEGAALLLSEEDARALHQFFQSDLQAALAKGLRIQTDRAGVRGFKVSLANGQVVHDFSAAAIAGALGELVRPQLAEMLRRAVPAPTA